ncbi:MAG: polysaccharide deacetylase family protein [bacterium]
MSIDWKMPLREGIYRFLRLLSNSSEPVRPILLYHTVGGDLPQSIALDAFKDQMSYLADNFSVHNLNDFTRELERNPDRNLACVTFDDGHRDNYEKVLPVLNDRNISGTFFITTGSIGDSLNTWSGESPMMSRVELKTLAKEGHELGAHTVNHVKLPGLNEPEIEREILDSKKRLEGLAEKEVKSFAYPKGAYDEGVRNIVEKLNFNQAVTVEEGLVDPADDLFTLPRVWIGPGMNLSFVQDKLSPALETYRTIRNLIPL